jgi:uncharacterized beta-barrel protein YwiB (DUF1934 family)
VSEDEFDLEKVLKKISEAWEETKEHFGITGDLNAKVKVEGWKDMNIKIKSEGKKDDKVS